MDVRGVERMLEKTYGMADTALAAGAKTIEGIARDARVPDHAKRQLIPLFRREAALRTLNYANLGLAVCEVLETEMDDAAARARLEFYRAGFQSIQTRAQTELAENSAGRAVEAS